jgi:hypothetical protein
LDKLPYPFGLYLPGKATEVGPDGILIKAMTRRAVLLKQLLAFRDLTRLSGNILSKLLFFRGTGK